VLIGKIVGAHGLKGTTKIQSYAESLEIFKSGTVLLVSSPDGSENRYEIDWIKPHSRGALLTLKEITGRDQAESLIGSELYIEKAELPELEPGAYYWFDLVGVRVYTSDDRAFTHQMTVTSVASLQLSKPGPMMCMLLKTLKEKYWFRPLNRLCGPSISNRK
jgi:16S rRNA processing protein RimM